MGSMNYSFFIKTPISPNPASKPISNNVNVWQKVFKLHFNLTIRQLNESNFVRDSTFHTLRARMSHTRFYQVLVEL